MYSEIEMVWLMFVGNVSGISDENLAKLAQHAQIPQEEKCILTNMQNLGVPIIQDASWVRWWRWGGGAGRAEPGCSHRPGC